MPFLITFPPPQMYLAMLNPGNPFLSYARPQGNRYTCSEEQAQWSYSYDARDAKISAHSVPSIMFNLQPNHKVPRLYCCCSRERRELRLWALQCYQEAGSNVKGHLVHHQRNSWSQNSIASTTCLPTHRRDGSTAHQHSTTCHKLKGSKDGF